MNWNQELNLETGLLLVKNNFDLQKPWEYTKNLLECEGMSMTSDVGDVQTGYIRDFKEKKQQYTSSASSSVGHSRNGQAMLDKKYILYSRRCRTHDRDWTWILLWQTDKLSNAPGALEASCIFLHFLILIIKSSFRQKQHRLFFLGNAVSFHWTNAEINVLASSRGRRPRKTLGVLKEICSQPGYVHRRGCHNNWLRVQVPSLPDTDNPEFPSCQC